MYKHVFFDLDKTLTKSRSSLLPDQQELFEKLCAVKDIIVVTGGSTEQIREQITPRFDGKYFALPQSGNQALDKSGEEFWNEPLDDSQVSAIMEFIEFLKKYFNIKVRDENDIIENRGAQVSYSVIGFHEDVKKKYAFDPDDKKRQAALAAHPDALEKLRKKRVDVTPAGTTVFNFIPLGKHKGFNIARFLELKGWEKEECLYVGDALFPGGNDETVIGVIPTHAVKDPNDTFDYIARKLLH